MKITVFIPEEMLGKDLEITLHSRGHIEATIEEKAESIGDELERENTIAKTRLKSLDVLEPKCNWSSPCPTREEREARERWQWLMDQQSLFEQKWNL